MNLEELREQAISNSARWFPDLHARDPREQVLHQTLGIAGEVGEFVNLIKKANRGDEAEFFQNMMGLDVAFELADIFTYLLNLCSLLGVDLEQDFQAKQAVCERRWGS